MKTAPSSKDATQRRKETPESRDDFPEASKGDSGIVPGTQRFCFARPCDTLPPRAVRLQMVSRVNFMLYVLERNF